MTCKGLKALKTLINEWYEVMRFVYQNRTLVISRTHFLDMHGFQP